jgi:hypothetical protein
LIGLSQRRLKSLNQVLFLIYAVLITGVAPMSSPRGIETHLPRIRIEDLLVEVDRWCGCGFTRELVPLLGYHPRTERPYAALLAALVAHGTSPGWRRPSVSEIPGGYFFSNTSIAF